MMRNKWFLSFILTLACIAINAQENTSIVTGLVVDIDGSPMIDQKAPSVASTDVNN